MKMWNHYQIGRVIQWKWAQTKLRLSADFALVFGCEVS